MADMKRRAEAVAYTKRGEQEAPVTIQEIEAAHRRCGLYKLGYSVEKAMSIPMIKRGLIRSAKAYRAKKPEMLYQY